jgi:alpha-glucosidase (family GH31 glycosyl hydrolase)
MSILLKQIQEEDDEFVAKQELLGVDDPNNEVYWTDMDEYNAKETEDHDFGEEDCDETPDIQAGIRDFLVEDNVIIDSKKRRNLTPEEAKKAMAAAQKRKQ